MTVGIIGAGRMGRALAHAITGVGERVLLATGREVGRAAPGPEPLPPGCRMAPLGEVWRRATTVLVALPFPVALELMSGPAGAVGAGRTLIDVTNPAFAAGGLVPPGRSGGELMAGAAGSWQVVKAFNTVPASQVRASRVGGRPVTVPVAGARPAKAVAFALARRIGFEPLDAGGIAASLELESLAVLLSRISAQHGMHGRVAIHIGRPDSPSGPASLPPPVWWGARVTSGGNGR
jgi:predicted dinucleotide-binding enzyme